MSSFRTFHAASRAPAIPMSPVVDPAGWSPESLRDVGSWSYRFTKTDADEVITATQRLRRLTVRPEAIDREKFPLPGLGGVMADVRRELMDGRGIVMLQGFPTAKLDRLGQVIAYLGLGSYLGRPVSQNREGHILGHVKDLGGDYADPVTRGYRTRASLFFHADGGDYVGLLCLQSPRSGGESRVASSVTVYNRILAQRPDLAHVLMQPFHRSLKGDVDPGDCPWLLQPMFCVTDGYFSATGAGSAIDKAQGLPGVPPLTPAQREAIEFYRMTVEACAADIPFEPGDVQFLNNFVTLHSRRAYDDWPEPERKRHLLRLWLADPEGRRIPPEQRAGYEGRGIRLRGAALNAPLDVLETASRDVTRGHRTLGVRASGY
jgi:hypothetical protein